MKDAKKVVMVFIILATGLVCSSAYGVESGSDEWQLSVAPYFWFAGIDGDMTVNGNSTEVDVGFSDIWDALDFAGSVHIEAQKGKWGILLDTLYMDLSMEKDMVIPPTAEVDIEMWVVEVGGFYQVGQWSLGDNTGRSTRIQVIGGGRYWDLDQDVDLGPVSRGKSSDWIDPFIGLRLFVDIKDWLILRVRGDIGGFAVSSDAAEFTWNLFAGPVFKVSEKLYVVGGYRWLDLELEDGSTSEINVTFEGPMVGANIRF